MSLINLLPQKIKEELRSKSLLKVISGLNNFDVQSVKIKIFHSILIKQIKKIFLQKKKHENGDIKNYVKEPKFY